MAFFDLAYPDMFFKKSLRKHGSFSHDRIIGYLRGDRVHRTVPVLSMKARGSPALDIL
ncbi:hypothetical protein HK405_009221 [Cladochytrium tenue]|nr:hypothetical protein HK405_009221 [Cladochytrium tenue]